MRLILSVHPGSSKQRIPLTHDTKSSYTVTVTVYDGNSGGDRITVTIDVTENVEDENVRAAPSVDTSPIIPENTALLTNFPNPFNPETWIPYQLAKTGSGYVDDIRYTRCCGAGVEVRASTCRCVSRSEPCDLLGWQQCVR